MVISKITKNIISGAETTVQSKSNQRRSNSKTKTEIPRKIKSNTVGTNEQQRQKRIVISSTILNHVHHRAYRLSSDVQRRNRKHDTYLTTKHCTTALRQNMQTPKHTQRFTSRHVKSYHNKSHRIISYHIILQQMSSNDETSSATTNITTSAQKTKTFKQVSSTNSFHSDQGKSITKESNRVCNNTICIMQCDIWIWKRHRIDTTFKSESEKENHNFENEQNKCLFSCRNCRQRHSKNRNSNFKTNDGKINNNTTNKVSSD